MSHSLLSPIVSSDLSSSSAIAADERQTGRQFAQQTAAAKLLSRTPSTCSQLSDTSDDDQLNFEQDDDNEICDEQDRLDYNRMKQNRHREARRKKSAERKSANGLQAAIASASQQLSPSTTSGPQGGSFSSTGSSSLAQQYLFTGASTSKLHSNNTNHHHYAYLTNMQQHRKKFKQILQSIPLPMVATSIITVFILCLLLSGCKSLQLASSSPTLQDLRLESGAGGVGGESETGLPVHLGQQQASLEPLGPPMSETPRGVGVEAAGWRDEEGNLRGLARELAMKRDYVNSLLQQRQQLQRRTAHRLPATPNQQHKRHSGPASPLESGNLEALSTMLFNQQDAPTGLVVGELTASGGQTDPEGQFLDGESSVRGKLEARHTSQPAPAKPARLLANPQTLEIDQNEEVQLGASSSGRNHYHQAPNNNDDNNNNKIHNDNEPSPMQQQQHGDNDHNRRYDVFQIQCNKTELGFERFACPTPDPQGRYRCIEDRNFCDGYFDCPGEEDEERINCMYYKLFISHIDMLTNTIVSMTKKQNRLQQNHNHQMSHRIYELS